MNKQLSLFEEPGSGLPKFKRVLAVFPDDYTAAQIGSLANGLRETHGLRGKIRPVNHLHVSLPLPRHFVRGPESAVEIIGRVCETVAAVTPSFEIRFERVMSFPKPTGNHTLVLVGESHGNDGIMHLHGMLRAEFAKYHLRTSKLVPHLTLLYDKKELTSSLVEPVCWTVKEIVLVNSEVGATKYHRLGCWKLGGTVYFPDTRVRE